MIPRINFVFLRKIHSYTDVPMTTKLPKRTTLRDPVMKQPNKAIINNVVIIHFVVESHFKESNYVVKTNVIIQKSPNGVI